MFCVNAILSVVACIFCIQTVLNFTQFSSTQSKTTPLTVKSERPKVLESLDDRERWEVDKAYFWEVVHIVIWDVMLVLLFVLQHRVMASQWWKDLLSEIGIHTAQRSLYVIASCWTLQYLMQRITPIRATPLWYIDTSEHRLFWILFAIIHFVAWVLIYGTCLVMDLAELIGLKQTYYEFLDVKPPLAHKSAPTRRLYSHMRHGSVSCLFVIFWVHPMMTWTRVVLASTLMLFATCGFAVHEVDYIYLREQFARKRISIRLQRGKTIELLN